MTQTIRLFDIYCADLFSRAKAAQLAKYVHSDADSVVLDFTDINFMSRSFTDELYNVISEQAPRTFTFTGQNQDIAMMMSIVSDSRSRERRLGVQHPQMLTFETKDTLAEFLVKQ